MQKTPKTLRMQKGYCTVSMQYPFFMLFGLKRFPCV